MIEALVIKSFKDIENGKVFLKDTMYISNDLERCTFLEENNYIKITRKSDEFLTYPELRKKYSMIKAKSKKEFLNKIKEL